MNDDKILNELFGGNETSIDIALSYSRASDFDRNGPNSLIKRSEIDTQSVKIGSITDDLLNDDFDFNSKYYIFEGIKPTATAGKLVDIITYNYNEKPSKEDILEIAKKNEFWKRFSDEKMYEAFDTDDFNGYIEAFYESKNKIVITTDDYNLGSDLANIIKTHEFSKYIFSDRYERINQFGFNNLMYKGIKWRGYLDFALIDHKLKTVNFIDLKTGQDSALDFMKSFLKWRYYLQEAIYMKAFKLFCEEYNLKGYKLLPFKFLYISRYEKIPLDYTVSNKWHKAAINGFTTNSGYVYKGLDQIIEDINWHWDNKVFDMPRKIYESEGSLMLDDKFIIMNN